MQISRQIRAKILSGDLPDGTLINSIRSFARQQSVSVITVQRACDDLAREGLLVSHRGKGYFVAGLSVERKTELAKERLREKLRPIIADAMAGGLSAKTISGAFQEICKSEGGSGK